MGGSVTIPVNENTIPHDDGNQVVVNENTIPHDDGDQVVGNEGITPSPQSHNVDTGEQVQAEELGIGHRKKHISVRLRDYVTNTIQKMSPSHSTPLAQSTSSSTPYPIGHYVNSEKNSSCYRTFLKAITAEREPVTYSEAVKDKRWRSAMDSELEDLEQNKTWTIEKLPPDKKTLGCKWVYKKTKQWELHQMDVHNAFLHEDLEEEVFMKLSPGLHKGQHEEACKLRKSLYGLRQAPRCWFSKLSSTLKKYRFVQSYSDYSLFTLQQNGVQLNVLVYVDDLIVSRNDHEAITQFKTYLSNCFHMKDLGNLKYFLGIEVACAKEGILLCKQKYALDIIFKVGLLGAKPAKIPIQQNHRLGLAQGRLFEDPEQYQRLVGRLIYLCFTRPDLAYSVHILTQFMQNPQIEHWEAAIRVIRYLKGSPGQGIILRNNYDLQLRGWCDTDWAGCPLTRRSLTGWLVYLGDSPISWKTKKQHIVSLFSAEAEYRSMALTRYCFTLFQWVYEKRRLVK
ncbi:retrovirus-related pol polyprotein from transposon TNT 1-94 [Tanacetum coccineum]